MASHTFLAAIVVEDDDSRSRAAVKAKEIEREFNTEPEDERYFDEDRPRMHVLLNLEYKDEDGGDTYPVIGIHDIIS